MTKLTIRKTGLVLLGLVFILTPATPALAVTPASTQPLMSRPMFMSRGHSDSSATGAALTQSTSENWSGYAATAANNSFSSVSSNWVQPTLNCASVTTSYSAYWVGIDGYSDQTVEQIGTEANCVNGQPQSYTWYEMYPQNPSEVLVRLSVAPGNVISASVTYNPPVTVSRDHRRVTSSSSFTLTLADITTGASYSTTQAAYLAANRSSAEVIAEAPYSNGILPLANFGVANFSSSKVNGLALGNAAGLEAVTMDDPHGMIATPSTLDATKENFSITWTP